MEQRIFPGGDAYHIPDDLFDGADAPGVYKRFAPKQMIYWQDDDASAFYYLKSGSVRIFVASEDGAEKTLAIYHSGSIFGEASFFDGLPRISSARAITQADLLLIDRENLLACFQRKPALALSIIEFLSKTVRMLSTQLDGMTFLPADRRIARLLLEENRQGTVSHTHEDIGSLAGASRVTVSRTLGAFERAGWVRTGYRCIALLDEDALRRFAQNPTER